MLLLAGQLAGASGDYGTEQLLHEAHLAIWRKLGNKREIASSLLYLAYGLRNTGDYARARPLADESLEVVEQTGDKGLLAFLLAFCGSIILEEGDHVLARAHLERSLAVSKELGERANQKAHQSLAVADRALGAFTSARAHLREALAISREHGWHRFIPNTLVSVAGLEAEERRAERAARLLGAADGLREALGVHFSVSESEEYERERAIVAVALGEAAFAVAWGEGQAMTLEEAIAFALDDTSEG
jgi:tetratricopeptide (TPR) repeat protein